MLESPCEREGAAKSNIPIHTGFQTWRNLKSHIESQVESQAVFLSSAWEHFLQLVFILILSVTLFPQMLCFYGVRQYQVYGSRLHSVSCFSL